MSTFCLFCAPPSNSLSPVRIFSLVAAVVVHILAGRPLLLPIRTITPLMLVHTGHRGQRPPIAIRCNSRGGYFPDHIPLLHNKSHSQISANSRHNSTGKKNYIHKTRHDTSTVLVPPRSLFVSAVAPLLYRNLNQRTYYDLKNLNIAQRNAQNFLSL